MRKTHNYFLMAMFCGIVAFSLSLAISAQTISAQTISVQPTVTKAITAINSDQSISVTQTSASTGTVTVKPKTISSKSTAESASAITEKSATIKNILAPDFSFSSLRTGATIKGSIDIVGTVSGASAVEFYLVPTGSNIYKYLGSAKEVAENTWSYSFNSLNFPNGSFDIEAKVTNIYGAYESSRNSIIIANPSGVSALATDLASEQSSKADVSNEKGQNYNGNTSNEWQKRYFGSDECMQENVCGELADPDMDGLNNGDEYRYGTDPTNPDSDQDGFLDGDEVRNGFDPLKASSGNKNDKIVFENPKDNGQVDAKVYKVEKVEMVKSTEGEKHLKLSGKAIPNSFVTIYIYSDPIILTVKTDADGNWSYELDKNLEDGEHHAYVAVTDNSGKITNKSEPVAFVKVAQAVEMVTPVEASAAQRAVSPTEVHSKNDLVFFIAIVLSALAIILAALGLYRHQAMKKEDDIINN